MNEVLVDARCVDWDWRLGDNGRYEKAYILTLVMRMWFREHNVSVPSVVYFPKNGRWNKRDKVSLFFEDASQAMMFKLKWVPEDYLT